MLRSRRFAKVLIVLIAAGSWPALADEPKTPRELLKEAIQSYPETPFTAKAKLSWESMAREMMLSHRRLDDQTSGSYLEVTAPPKLKGTRFCSSSASKEETTSSSRCRRCTACCR